MFCGKHLDTPAILVTSTFKKKKKKKGVSSLLRFYTRGLKESIKMLGDYRLEL